MTELLHNNTLEQMNRAIATAVGMAWTLLVLMGLSAMYVAGKASFYFFVPLAMLGLVVAAFVISRYRAIRYFTYLTYVLALLALPCYLFFRQQASSIHFFQC